MSAPLPKPISVQTINSLRQKDAAPELNYETHRRTFQALNQVITYLTSPTGAVVVVDGSQFTTLQQAFQALPAQGGTIDMRSNSNPAALNLGTFNAGIKAVTILLGPFTYSIGQFTLTRALHIIGAGGYPDNSTILQAAGGNSTPPFVIDQSTAAQDVILQGFQLRGTPGNTSQTAINLIAPPTFGLWYSCFDDIYINGFMGIGINFDGQASGAIHQFSTFRRVIVIRPVNGNYALQIIGVNNSLKFENCEFDGTFNAQDGKTNINILQGTATFFVPYDIKFDLLTCQFAGKGIVINGADAVTIDHGHFESVEGVFEVNATIGSYGLTINDSGFFANSGIGSAGGLGVGNGFIVNATTNLSWISVLDCHAYNIPDTYFKGNLNNIVQWGVTQGAGGNFASLPPVLGSPIGFGTGSAGTTVTTTTKGGGTGPTNPQTVVRYQQISISGTTYWIPLML